MLGADTQAIYSTDKPLVEFDEEIEYSALLYIHEIGSNNDANTSNNDIEFGYTAESFPSNGITYQLSPNKGIDWYYYNGDDWQATDGEWQTSNTIQEINLNLAKYNELESSSLMLRAYFHSDGNALVSLQELIVGREVSLVQEEVVTPDIDAEADVVATERFLDEYRPIILNASWFEGNKIIAGRIEIPAGIAIEESELEKFKVHIYYSNADSATKNELIGSVEIIQITGEVGNEYVFELQTPSQPGGYITAELEYVDGEFIHNSPLAEPVENSTFTVTQTGDQADPSLNGNCDVDFGTPGSQCTLRAAIQEANRLTDADNIHFNIPGAGVHTIQPASVLPEVRYSAYVDASTQPGASCNDLLSGQGHNLLIEINGSNAGTAAYGLGTYQQVTDVTIRGFIINGFVSGGGIKTGSTFFYQNPVGTVRYQCNFLGVDATGSYSVPNLNGMLDSGYPPHTILGGSNLGDGNLISGIAQEPIRIAPVYTSFAMYGNVVGLDATGTYAIPNNTNRVNGNVYLRGGGNMNIGGPGQYERNVISGNPLTGLYMRLNEGTLNTTQIIENNYIGVGVDGVTSIPNGYSGMFVYHSQNYNSHVIIRNNLVAEHERYGIEIRNIRNPIIEGNTVYDNPLSCIYVTNWVYNSIIRNNELHDCGYGIHFWRYNYGSLVGGTDPADGNNIYDSGIGIFLQEISVNGITMLGNTIDNDNQYGLPIEFNTSTPKVNDFQDPDGGTNNNQNNPELVAGYDWETLNIVGTFNSTPNRAFRIEFFSTSAPHPSGHGDAEGYIGYVDVLTDANGDFDFSLLPLDIGLVTIDPGQTYLSATATRCNTYNTGPVCTTFGDTSEMSNTVEIIEVTSAPDLAVFIDANSNTTNSPDTQTFVVQYENRGEDLAENVELEIVLPNGIGDPTEIIAENTNDGVGVTCAYDQGLKTITCTLSENMLGGDYGQITFVAPIDTGLTQGAILSVNTSISTASFDFNQSNNNDTTNIYVGESIDMAAYITSNRSVGSAGDYVTIKAKYVNNGYLSAAQVMNNLQIASALVNIQVSYPSTTNIGASIECAQNVNSGVHQCAKQLVTGLVPINTNELLALVGWGDTNELLTVDPENMNIESSVFITYNSNPVYYFGGMAYNPVDNQLYVLARITGGPGAPWDLAKLNPYTGELTLIGTQSQRMSTITFTSDGKLYSTTGPSNDNSNPDSLFEINLNTGTETLLTSLPSSNSGSTLIYDYDNNKIIRLHSYERYAEVLNATTFAIENTFQLEDPMNTYDPPTSGVYEGNGIFIVTFWDSEVARFDMTGTYSLVDHSPIYSMKGLAYPRNVIGVSSDGSFASGESMIIEISGNIANTVSSGNVLTSKAITETSSTDFYGANNIAVHNILIGSATNVYLDPIETEATFADGKVKYSLKYGNNGDIAASDSYIEIRHPDILDYESSRIVNGSNSISCNPAQTYLICSFGSSIAGYSADTLEVIFDAPTLDEGDIVKLPSEIFTSSDDYNSGDNYLEYILGISLPSRGGSGGNNPGKVQVAIPTPTATPDIVPPDREGVDRPEYDDRETIVSLPDTGTVTETKNNNLILALIIPALAATGTIIFAYPGVLAYSYYFILGIFKDKKFIGKIYNERDYERIAFVVVKLYNRNKLVDVTASNLDGQYKLKKVNSTKIVFSHPEYETYTDLINIKDKDSLMTTLHKVPNTKLTNIYKAREYVRANLGLINSIWFTVGLSISLMSVVYVYRNFHLAWLLLYILMLASINLPKKVKRLVITD
ncbi:right-handed parallel beta-helix repeat-containing protein [Candidatus Dojkabacteria bacterium]|uniref:Right-handed parallel beta-helix repeat-containing protein n=1 Tax=Candidatus Dojkabacteria bacterium TaxID=2099670 RepID=A0A955L5Y5_9BACT|nr:right-handed parallel beta-helix repeat-containing protein [Candidatus Dojkabacteria bacterium]